MMSVYDPISHGAKGDGHAIDTKAIQKAIDVAFDNGGGTVVFKSGKTYMAGSLVLKSNVWLHMEAGSVLQHSGVSLKHIN